MTSAEPSTSASVKAGPKQERLDVRLNHDQKVLLKRAAAIEGTTVSNFVVRSVQQAAERAIREHQVVMLSARDSLVLVEALLNPPEPSARLRAAVAHHQRLVEEA